MSNQDSIFYKRNLAVPFFTQRDNTYVWQQINIDSNLKKGPQYPMAWRSCNITSLCMILRYWGLTEETPNQMIEKVFSKEDWGWSYEATDDGNNKKGASRLESWANLEEIAKLYKKDRNCVLNIAPEGYKKYESLKSDMDYEWYINESGFQESCIFNAMLYYTNFFAHCIFSIKNIDKIKDGYKVTAVTDVWRMPDYNKHEPIIGKEIVLYMYVDGDYISILIDNKHELGVLMLVDNEIQKQVRNLLEDNTCNLSKITWPRHADGSCDYETAVRLQSGKRYRASDNLRLRSSGSTAGKPVVTIGKGTQVKVLSIGAEQTIDGITSNWVQVEVQAGAKDRDGKAIAAGTTGWCFGGYLK